MLRSPFSNMLSLNEESKMISTSLTGQRQPILSEGNVISTRVNERVANVGNDDVSTPSGPTNFQNLGDTSILIDEDLQRVGTSEEDILVSAVSFETPTRTIPKASFVTPESPSLNLSPKYLGEVDETNNFSNHDLGATTTDRPDPSLIKQQLPEKKEERAHERCDKLIFHESWL